MDITAPVLDERSRAPEVPERSWIEAEASALVGLVCDLALRGTELVALPRRSELRSAALPLAFPHLVLRQGAVDPTLVLLLARDLAELLIVDFWREVLIAFPPLT